MGEVIYFRHRTRYRPSDTPFSQMNITPLIDVMLVLLVMLILAVPAAMHQTSVDLPRVGPITTKTPPIIQNLVITSDGVAHWNGAIVDDATLRIGCAPLPLQATRCASKPMDMHAMNDSIS